MTTGREAGTEDKTEPHMSGYLTLCIHDRKGFFNLTENCMYKMLL